MLWTKLAPNPINFRVAADAIGNLYLGMTFDKSPYQLDSFTLTPSGQGSFDLVLAKLDTTTSPRLGIEKRTDGVQLSWSALASEFYLECATNVGSSFWSSNAAVPSVVGASNFVTMPSSEDGMFFRLKRP